MAKPTGFIEYERALPPDRRPRNASATGRNSTRLSAPRKSPASRPRAAWTAARPSATRASCTKAPSRAAPSTISSPSGTTSCIAAFGSRRSGACGSRTIFPSSRDASAPRPARAPAPRLDPEAGRRDQEQRGKHRRPRLGGEMDGARNARKRTGKRVAVVGSGPAGLACADQLTPKPPPPPW